MKHQVIPATDEMWVLYVTLDTIDVARVVAWDVRSVAADPDSYPDDTEPLLVPMVTDDGVVVGIDAVTPGPRSLHWGPPTASDVADLALARVEHAIRAARKAGCRYLLPDGTEDTTAEAVLSLVDSLNGASWDPVDHPLVATVYGLLNLSGAPDVSRISPRLRSLIGPGPVAPPSEALQRVKDKIIDVLTDKGPQRKGNLKPHIPARLREWTDVALDELVSEGRAARLDDGKFAASDEGPRT